MEKPRRKLYVPESLDRVLVPLVNERARHLLDHYRYIINAITLKRYTDKRFAEPDSYVPLSQRVLQQIISKRHTRRMLNDLIQWTLIEEKRSWLVSGFPIGFRLTEEYRQGRVLSLPITDDLLRRKVDSYRRIDFEALAALPAGYATVAGWLQHLSIDRVRAENYVRQHYAEGTAQHNLRMVGIDRVAEKDFWFVLGKKSTRAYHTVANLGRDIRPFLSIHGQELQQVDIKCSQPLFMHLLLRKMDWIDRNEKYHMEQTLLGGGDIYQLLNTLGLERHAFKEVFYREILFGRGGYSTPTSDRFNLLFPTYAKAIREFKKDGHEKFAALLQSEEATVVFAAVERFSRVTNCQAPILTVHDSLMTTPEFIQTARDVLRDSFIEQHGIEPRLEIK